MCLYSVLLSCVSVFKLVICAHFLRISQLIDQQPTVGTIVPNVRSPLADPSTVPLPHDDFCQRPHHRQSIFCCLFTSFFRTFCAAAVFSALFTIFFLHCEFIEATVNEVCERERGEERKGDRSIYSFNRGQNSVIILACRYYVVNFRVRLAKNTMSSRFQSSFKQVSCPSCVFSLPWIMIAFCLRKACNFFLYLTRGCEKYGLPFEH